MEYCIVYLSTVTELFSEKELVEGLRHWQATNCRLGITSVLLYFIGSILQVLEGPKAEIETLYNVIREDPRHGPVIQLYRSPIEERAFRDCSMGYKTFSGSDVDHLGNLIRFDGLPSVVKQDETNLVRQLAQLFYQNNYRN